eukprot:COSAG02_NODE_22_length_53020_cov_16.223125_2_plen_127_part_00
MANPIIGLTLYMRFICVGPGGASDPGTSLTRLALNFVYCCGWLQQQENQFLGVAHAEVVRMSSTMQSLLGYGDAVDFVRGSALLATEVEQGRGLKAAVNRAARPHAELIRTLIPVGLPGNRLHGCL